MFSHVQGEVFFLAALDTCWLPPRISVGICTPESCLLMPPLPSPPHPPGDPGSGVFTESDPWPPHDTGWCLGSSEEITAPLPAPTPAKHEYPPWHKSRRRLPQETGAGSLRGKEEALPPCAAWEPVFPRVQDAYLSGNMFLHVDVCFPMQTAPFSLALPCILRASGPPPPT